MNYTGEVTPEGPAQTLELDGLTLTKLAVDPEMSNNCYLLRCTRTGDQVLVDAAADARRLLELIGPGGLTTVVTTHQHWDHHRALAEVVAATGAETVAGGPDADAITEQTEVPIGGRVGDGDVVRVGDQELTVIAIAGHTPGSICLLHVDAAGAHTLLTGDSLFPGGVGNTFGDDAAFAQLLDQVETKLFAVLPDSTRFLPGHGNDGRLGEERPQLPTWRERGW